MTSEREECYIRTYAVIRKTAKSYGGNNIRNRVSIEEHPKVVDERSRFVVVLKSIQSSLDKFVKSW